MRRISVAVLVVVALSLAGRSASSDDATAKSVLDKAIKALGGEDKLSKAVSFTWKAKGKFNFGGNESEFSSQATAQGLDHYRSEFEADFGGNQVKGVTVIAGEKGWMKFGDMGMPIDGDLLKNEKRNVYMQIAAATVLPLNGKGFKLESADDEKIDDKPAAGLKVTGPDGRDFLLYFDKASGLPVRQVATVAGFMGEEFKQETNFSAYKEFGGIKRATKIEAKRDGQPFITQEVTEFKVLEKVPPETFEEPK